MSRKNTFFVCQSCGAHSRQYFGRCSGCGDWNSIIEQVNRSSNNHLSTKRTNGSSDSGACRSMSIADLDGTKLKRIKSGYSEFDRVLGGGLVPGSIVLLGGDPGIGKSTLLLQSATTIAHNKTVLYVSAEESSQQVKLRWQRLEGSQSNLKLLAETDLELVIEEIEILKPKVAIIDSIQALYDNNMSSAPGSVSQVRECAATLQRIAKRQDVVLVLVGHVTKEGVIAGPKVLEHLVDAVLTFEGDRFASHRLLRAVKNRYGATHELGIFEMRSEGLSEVVNPSEIFLSGESASGVSTIVACEGTRSILVDLQALISASTYPSPRRTATGIGTNRLHQILAVLEKHLKLTISRFDCYLAVAGGLEVEEPAADLGIATAIVSSYKNIKLPKGTVLIGELGLGGQLRPVGQMPQRLHEADRLGFQRVVIPKRSNIESIKQEIGLEILEASSIAEAITMALGEGNYTQS